jgi:amino acid permease
MKRLIIAIVVLIGLVFIAVGIIYFVVKAGSLPSFFPGHVKGSTNHHDKRGLIAVVIGVVLLLAPLVSASLGRRHS